MCVCVYLTASSTPGAGSKEGEVVNNGSMSHLVHAILWPPYLEHLQGGGGGGGTGWTLVHRPLAH